MKKAFEFIVWLVTANKLSYDRLKKKYNIVF